MNIRRIETRQYLPIGTDEAWRFFSDPRNLNAITPPEMDFRILTPDLPAHIHPGMIITYTVKPVLQVPMTWVTEITQVEEGKFFIDDQRSGPYALWHHQHHFIPMGEGTEMRDIIHYKLPLGFLGDLVGQYLVDKKVKDIFTYREKRLKELFQKK